MGLIDPCTMAPASPVVATDVPGTRTALAGGSEVETSSLSDNVLGIAAWLREVVLLGEKDVELLCRLPELPIGPIIPERERGVVAHLKLPLKL